MPLPEMDAELKRLVLLVADKPPWLFGYAPNRKKPILYIQRSTTTLTRQKFFEAVGDALNDRTVVVMGELTKVKSVLTFSVTYRLGTLNENEFKLGLKKVGKRLGVTLMDRAVIQDAPSPRVKVDLKGPPSKGGGAPKETERPAKKPRIKGPGELRGASLQELLERYKSWHGQYSDVEELSAHKSAVGALMSLSLMAQRWEVSHSSGATSLEQKQFNAVKGQLQATLLRLKGHSADERLPFSQATSMSGSPVVQLLAARLAWEQTRERLFKAAIKRTAEVAKLGGDPELAREIHSALQDEAALLRETLDKVASAVEQRSAAGEARDHVKALGLLLSDSEVLTLLETMPRPVQVRAPLMAALAKIDTQLTAMMD